MAFGGQGFAAANPARDVTFPWLVAGAVAITLVTGAVARLTRRPALAAVAGATVLLVLHGRTYFGYTSDDAYISYRYARNFSDGLGLVWNPGEYVEGYSNFLWVLILAGVDRAGGDIVPAARWIGIALAIATIAATYRLSRELLAGEAGAVAGVAAALLLAASGPFALWSGAGLETSLFALLIAGAVLLHARETGARWQPSGILWGFAALTRPDAPLLFAVSAVHKLVEERAAVRASWSERRAAALRLAVWAAGFVLIFAPYFAWRYTTYDYLFPNTYYAKIGSGLDQYERGLTYLQTFAREYGIWLLLVVPVAALAGRLRAPMAWHALSLMVAYGAYLVYAGGDSLVRFRLLAPLLPLFYGTVVASIVSLVTAQTLEARAPRAGWAAGGVAFAGFLLFTLHASSTDYYVPPEREAVEHRAAIGRWLRGNVPADTLIAVIPAGAIPYESRLDTIDMLGINDEHIAHRKLDLGSFAAGHEKYDTEYVLDRRPDIIVLEDGLSAAPRDRDGYAGLASGLILARIDMLNNPRLWDEYQPRTVQVREGAWFNLLVRRDAIAVLERTGPPPTGR